jgi:hypothetical protein
VVGWVGGGSWALLTVPAGAGVSGSGWVSIEEKRCEEQPPASSAASETASRLPRENSIPNLRRRRRRSAMKIDEISVTKMAISANCNPIWLK